jgi:hypothetical protein
MDPTASIFRGEAYSSTLKEKVASPKLKRWQSPMKLHGKITLYSTTEIFIYMKTSYVRVH